MGDLLVALSFGHGREDYEAIGNKAFGRVAQVITMLLIFILTWLAMVAYAVLIGELLTPVFQLFGLSITELSRKLILVSAIACVSPLCFFKTLTALRFASVITVA